MNDIVFFEGNGQSPEAPPEPESVRRNALAFYPLVANHTFHGKPDRYRSIIP